ncbi:phage tail assembly chaperone [Aureimonas sp. AU20]|uniref:phage tail assembly chaperone n=1 Tax=Aureimonas sp. AU20 TaxID=1349819 RepID=UPI00072198DD|nr:phage tail assembly chaperone [Aureimonas sp. AU20]ALN73585.1 hypothetical protein M673_12725 [Aureimonas sp. AU20]
MTWLAEKIEMTIGGETVELRPTLRAALRLARDFNGYQGLLSAMSEGSMTVLARIVRECFPRPALPHDLFPNDRPLAQTIADYRLACIALVSGFLASPQEDKPDSTAQGASREGEKPFDAVRYFEDLFGFAIGILKWPPETAWNATPGEIRAAMAFRERVYAPKDEKKRKDEIPYDQLTLSQKARKLFANIGTRIET